MQVAIDGRLISYTTGGIAHYARKLAMALANVAPEHRFTLLMSARRSVDIDPSEIVARPGLGRPRNVSTRRSVVVYTGSDSSLRTARILTPPHHRWEQLTLPLELWRLRPDLLHSPDFIPPFRRPCPAVITVHDLGFLYFPETLTEESRRYYGQVGRAVRSAERIIAVSHHTARDLAERLGATDRVRVIHNGVGAEFHPAPEAEVAATRASYDLDKPYVLFLGTFEPRKNVVTLLRAFRAIRARHDVLLLLAGRRGWLYQPIFDEIERLSLRDDVRVVEHAKPQDFRALYTGAVAFAYPSLYEGFGLPPLEAMACGTPTVVADTSSLPEVVGDAALRHRPTDHEALADALLRLLEDEDLRANLRRRGLEQAARFSWDEAARQTLAVYREALDE